MLLPTLISFFGWTSKVSVTGKTVQLVLETTVDEANMKLHETWGFNQP
jgi:hypothetical protein